MNNHKAFALLSFCVLISMSIPLLPCFSIPDHTLSYFLQTEASKYRLNVTVSESLYAAYRAKSHKLGCDKFVTPHAFIQVANQIEDLFTDEEDFVNAVLMIVHQIPYAESGPLKYPVETIVENKGDCDLFSLIAASIIKARGLDVILLTYLNHMNLGVHLNHAPLHARYWEWHGVNYTDKKFYIAETTGGNWENGWRVGESPEKYKGATTEITSLENCETSSPGQVTVSLAKLESLSPPPPLPPSSPSSAPLIGYERLLIAFVTVAGAGLFYGFLRLHRKKKPEEGSPTDVAATASVDSKALEKLEVKEVCPKCGAWISTDGIDYCVCGEKLRPQKSEPAIIFSPPTVSIPPRDGKFPVAEILPEGVWCVCSKCGAYISANTEYCSCGAKLPKRQ